MTNYPSGGAGHPAADDTRSISSGNAVVIGLAVVAAAGVGAISVARWSRRRRRRATGPATLTGKHRVGMIETCVPAFANATSYAYKWFASATQISGVAGSSYKISEKYFGKTLTCKVTATGSGGSTTATSAGHKVLVGAKLAAKHKPFLHHGSNKSTAKKGVTELVDHGTWSPAGTSYSYQWFIAGKRIAGATKVAYSPKGSDVGKKLSCRVTAHRHGWTNGVATTATLGVVA